MKKMAEASISGRTLFFGRFISTPGPETLLVQQGAVLVSSTDSKGVIDKVDWTVRSSGEALARWHLDQDLIVFRSTENGFFFPGFVDTHIHAPQYPNAGIFGKSTLLDWLTTYTFPLEASLGGHASLAQVTGNGAEQNGDVPLVKRQKLDHLQKASTIYNKIVSRTLSYGTTTASYFATISVPATNLLANIAHQQGQRAYIGRVCMDHPETCPEYYRDETPEQSISNAISSIEHIQRLDPEGDLVAPIITPRFAPSCQDETLHQLGKLAQERDLRVQTHISENKGEVELVKHLFPERTSYTDVYDHAGLLTNRTILAHGIHLSDEEISTIRSRKSKISHCPASNSAIGSGFCPVRKLLDSGVDVSLGTDVSGGYSVSMLESVRQACLVSRQLGYLNGGEKKWNIGDVEGLWLATIGGAKCVGMAGRLGGFEEGMLFDVQEIDMSNGPVDIFGWETWEEKVDKWVWNGDDRNVKRVWVGGRLVHERSA